MVGGKAYTMREIIQIISQKMNQERLVLPVPKRIFVWLSRFRADFDESLLAAIDDDESFDASILTEHTGVVPRTFADGVLDLLR